MISGVVRWLPAMTFTIAFAPVAIWSVMGTLGWPIPGNVQKLYLAVVALIALATTYPALARVMLAPPIQQMLEAKKTGQQPPSPQVQQQMAQMQQQMGMVDPSQIPPEVQQRMQQVVQVAQSPSWGEVLELLQDHLLLWSPREAAGDVLSRVCLFDDLGGGAITVRMKNVYFTSSQFSVSDIFINNTVGTNPVTVSLWENVRQCTLVGSTFTPGSAISQPPGT